MRSSPLNGSSRPPEKKNVTWAYFSVSAMRSWVLPLLARYSPSTFSRLPAAKAEGAGMLAAYWVSMTKPASFGWRARSNSLKPSSTNTRRADHLQQGRLGHVARPLRPGRRLAQIRAGQPRPEPATPGPRLRGHLLFPPLRPGHPAGRNRQRPGHCRAAGQGVVHRHLVLLRGENPRNGRAVARVESAVVDSPTGLQPAQSLGGKGPAGRYRRTRRWGDCLHAIGPRSVDRQIPQRHSEGCAGQPSGRW